MVNKRFYFTLRSLMANFNIFSNTNIYFNRFLFIFIFYFFFFLFICLFFFPFIYSFFFSFIEEVIEFESSCESEKLSQKLSQKSVGTYSDVDINFYDDNEPQAKKQRGSVNVFTPKVAMLDKLRISNTGAVMLIGSISEASGYDLQSLILNEKSAALHRSRLRKLQADKI